MNLPNPTSRFEGRRGEQASVLIIVLWIAIGLVSIALYFANSMTYELRASDNRVAGLVTDQAIEGASRYVGYVLSNFATNGNMPDLTQYSAEAVELGDAHFWIIGRAPSADASAISPQPTFGLIDEASKLNLNSADTNALSYLPGMDLNFAEAVVDWRSTNGNMSLNYANLGYEAKHSPFETVDELRLVDGADMETLIGDDHNRNGILDTDEKNSSGLNDAGVLDFLTIYTREPNALPDGTALTNVNTQASLRSLLRTRFGAGRATTVMTRLFPSNANNIGNNGNGGGGNGVGGNGGGGNGGGGNGGGGNGGGGNGGGGGGTGGTTTYASLLQMYIRSGLTEDEFNQIYSLLTVSTAPYIRGRVNVNTASAEVLSALFMSLNNIDQNTASSAADQLVTYRTQNPGNLGSITWVVDCLGNTSPVLRALATHDYITTRTYQFTADIAAVGPYGRGYRRVKFIFDTSDGTPKVIYRQDLSRLGWALGDKARETWLAKVTQ